VSLDPHGRVVGKGDMNLQVRQTLEIIQSVLDHVDGTMAHIPSLTQYVTDIQQFMDAGAVRRQFFAEPLSSDDYRAGGEPLRC
jgi:enamine deaminase RidA (YjgF/YER057c/UK114 family)